jgi:hypothetical protein
MKKYYYGIRYLGGNRTCTTGEPNKQTGRMSRAISAEAFLTKTERDEWVNKENLYKPSGLGGGERIPATLAEIRKHQLGMSVEEFNEEIKYLHMGAEEEF